MYIKTEVSKYKDGLKIKLFQTENMYKIYFINEKGMYSFLNENIFNDCLDGKRPFLIFSIIYNGYDAIKEIKYILKNNVLKKQEELNLVNEYMKKIKI